MRFLGQSQELLHSHFRAFLERALAEAGVTVNEHPLLPFFIDSHAVELRDFVFTGVSLARQFRLPEIETLTGDAETMLRVDIWDALANHIDMAEARFSEGITRVVSLLLEAEVVRSSGHRVLDHAARRQVLSRWMFKPAVQAGAPVQALGRVPVEFRLDR